MSNFFKFYAVTAYFSCKFAFGNICYPFIIVKLFNIILLSLYSFFCIFVRIYYFGQKKIKFVVDKTREKLLIVAKRAFARFGFHKATMDKIARTAKKAKGSLYYYFTSKEELFREVVKDELLRVREELSKVVNSNEKTRDKIHRYMLLRMELMKQATSYHTALRADFTNKFNFLDDLRIDFEQKETATLKKMLSEGVEKGEIGQPENIDRLSKMFLMILKGSEVPFYLQNRYDDFKNHVDYLLSIILNGIDNKQL